MKIFTPYGPSNGLWVALFTLMSSSAWAQPAKGVGNPPSAQELPTITITGNPLGAKDLVVPAVQ